MLNMTGNIFFTFVLAGNLSMECFLAMSAFIGACKCMQIYDAQGGLGPLDCLKIILRKYLRYAPMTYFVFFTSWALVSRFTDGPMSFVNARLYQDCDKYWWSHILFIGNLYPMF